MRRVPHLLLALIFVAFTLDQLSICVQKGDRPLRRLDGQSERNSSDGARHFVQDGFRATSFLARYESPLNLNSGSAAIGGSNIYTHYFPGPDYVLAASYALFGADATVFQWTRLVPLAHVLGSVLLFLALAQRRLWPGDPWITVAMAALMLLPPAVRDWTLSLHGHAYSSAYVLLGLCLGLSADEGRPERWRLGGAFVLGLLSNYMLLTAAFVVFAAPLVGSLLSPDGRSHRAGFWSSIMVGLGLVTAFGLHFLQIASQFGWSEARLDQFGVLAFRSAGGGTGVSLGELFGQYQTDVTRFFGLSPLAMMLIGLWMAFCYPGQRRSRLRLALAVILAGSASWTWIFVMRQHAFEHGHVNPRIFLLVYVCGLACAGALAAARRSSHSSRAASGQTKGTLA